MRQLVEDLLDERKIRTVVCTTTLSHGIDYPVDNVIILISGFEKRWELDRYVCVQLKGRAGRPGKTVGRGRVFLVTEKIKASECMEKYIFGRPEAIYPETLTKDNLGRLILIKLNKLIRYGISSKEIIDTILKTLASRKGGINIKSLEIKIIKVLNGLREFGLLRSSGDNFQITDMDLFLNEISISPYDAHLVIKSLNKKTLWKINGTKEKAKKMKLKEERLEFGLLHLACCIDVAKRVREELIPLPHPLLKDRCTVTIVDPSSIKPKEFMMGLNKALILLDWINEVSLDQITQRYPFFQDYDVFQLGMYASRSLVKIAKIAEKLGMKSLAEIAQILAIRVRFGVKDDLAKTKLIHIRGIGRKRARLLFKKGFTIDKLSKSRPRELMNLLGSRELSKIVIKEARRIKSEER